MIEHIQNCDLLHFENSDAFNQWYTSYEFRPYSLDKNEAECSSLAYYLHALISASSESWPIRSTKSESPDFNVHVGTRNIGLEHSTITSTKYQQFRSESIRNPKQEIVWTDSFRIGGPAKEEYDRGWVGDSAEQEWVDLAIPRILDKLNKLNKKHFGKFERNELILNTVSYLPNLEMERAIPLLGKKINEKLASMQFASSFDSISLIYGTRTFPHALARSSQ